MIQCLKAQDVEMQEKWKNTWKSCFDNFWTKMPKNGHFDIVAANADATTAR